MDIRFIEKIKEKIRPKPIEIKMNYKDYREFEKDSEVLIQNFSVMTNRYNYKVRKEWLQKDEEIDELIYKYKVEILNLILLVHSYKKFFRTLPFITEKYNAVFTEIKDFYINRLREKKYGQDESESNVLPS